MDKIPSSPAPLFEIPAGLRMLQDHEWVQTGDIGVPKSSDVFSGHSLSSDDWGMVRADSSHFYFRPLPSGKAVQMNSGKEVGSVEGFVKALTPEEAEKLVYDLVLNAGAFQIAAESGDKEDAEWLAIKVEAISRAVLFHLTGGQK